MSRESALPLRPFADARLCAPTCSSASFTLVCQPVCTPASALSSVSMTPPINVQRRTFKQDVAVIGTAIDGDDAADGAPALKLQDARSPSGAAAGCGRPKERQGKRRIRRVK